MRQNSINFLAFFFSIFIFISGFSQEKRNSVEEKLTSQSYKAGAFIDVNAAGYSQTNFSIDQLVKDVLITGGSVCSTPNVTNVVVSPNLPVTSTSRSYGYFNKGTTAFPFKDGIVLSTGYASKAGNSVVTGTLSDNLGGAGDVDLATALGVSNFDLNDAVYIEFDFVPVSSQIKFNYLFASEEYTSSFPCSYTDGFALLLKKVGDPSYINLAKLPNGQAVSVTNVHPSYSFSGSTLSCGAVNAIYFGGYNNSTTVTNFNGFIQPMTATATVIPGQTYHFKMVLADYLDNSYDSAVFLEAGSFNIGVQINDPAGATLPAQATMCDATPQTLVAQVQGSGATFQWFLNNNPISGANSNTYTATQPGIYKVEVTVPGNNCPGTAQIEIISGTSPIANNASLSKCSTAALTTFNLNLAEPDISTTPGAVFKYYVNKADAIAGNANFILVPSAYVSGSKTIYVRVSNGACFRVIDLKLVIGNAVSPSITPSSNVICGNGSITLTSSMATGNVWSTGATTQSITVNSAGTYSVKTVNGTCESALASISVTQEPDPNLQISGISEFCDGFSTTLTSNSATGNVWSTGETTQSIVVNTAGTYTVTITKPSGCVFSKSVTVNKTPKIVANIATPSQITCAVSQVTLDASTSVFPAGATISWVASNGGNIVSGGNTLSPVVNAAGTYTLNINGVNCSDAKSIAVVEDKTLPILNLTSPKTTICLGESVTLSASGSVNYTWQEFLGNTSNSQTVTPTVTTTYTVLGTGVNGCKSLPKTITINVVPAIASTLEGGQICNGDNFTLDAGSGPNYSYLWSSGETTQSITVNQIGNYTVTINNGVCSDSFSTEIKQAAMPEITDVNYQNNTITVTSTNPSSGVLEYSIDSINWQVSNVFNNIDSNTPYSIFVRVKNTSCIADANYFTFFMPNVITPNGDGKNDTLDFTGIGNYSNFKAVIFDRYGKEIFRADNTRKIWNGTYNNRILPTSTYWYDLQWQDPINKKQNKLTGWILLKTR